MISDYLITGNIQKHLTAIGGTFEANSSLYLYPLATMISQPKGIFMLVPMFLEMLERRRGLPAESKQISLQPMQTFNRRFLGV